MRDSYPMYRIILRTHRSGSVLSVLYVKGDTLKDKTLGNTSLEDLWGALWHASEKNIFIDCIAHVNGTLF